MAALRRVLLFDLDGTLIDSAPGLTRAINILFAEVGRPPLSVAAVRRMVGDGVPVLIPRAMAAAQPPLDPAATAALLARYNEIYLAAPTADTTVYRGVPEILAGLRAQNFRMALCTNKLQKPTLKVLEAFELTRFFDAVAGGDVVPARKPDPAHLRAALAILGASPQEAVMIGDGINDVKAARGLGIPVLVLPSGYGTQPAEALGGDLLLADFAALPGALARLG
jgi:phosphoglycolate phosphatase